MRRNTCGKKTKQINYLLKTLNGDAYNNINQRTNYVVLLVLLAELSDSHANYSVGIVYTI